MLASYRLAAAPVVLAASFGLLIPGCVPQTGPSPAAQAPAVSAAALLPPVDLFPFPGGPACDRGPIGAAPSAPVIERKRKALVRNLEWLNRAIASASARGGPGAGELAGQVARLAREDAFARLDWSGSGSSPAHWQANLLKNVAIAMNLVDQREAWPEARARAEVVDWGRRLHRSATTPSDGVSVLKGWPDTRAAAAAAFALFGAASGDDAIFRAGTAAFEDVARGFRPGGKQVAYVLGDRSNYRGLDPLWMARLEDKMIGDLVIAAHAARRRGVDLYGRSIGGATLKDVVVWWQGVALEGTEPERMRGQDMSFLTVSGEERSWSWTEYWIADFPDDPRTAMLRETSRRIAAQSSYGYTGLATGPTTCMFR